MNLRTVLFLACSYAALGAGAQGLLGATERIAFTAGGSVFANMVPLFGNDKEVGGSFFHCISPQWELGLTVGGASMLVPMDIVEMSDDYKSGDAEIQGLMVRAEGRYYLRASSHSTAPLGYYIRPAFQFQRMGNEIIAKVEQTTPGSETTTTVEKVVDVEGKAMIIGFGFGRQTFFGEHFCLDWTLTTGYPISTSTEANTDKDVFSKEIVRTQMFGVRFGLGYQF